MQTWIAAWTIGAALAVTANASAQNPQSVLTVMVRVDDYANVSRKDLAKAEAQATATYRAAGLEVVWSPSESGSDAGSAATASRSIEVRVVILSRDMAEKKCRADALSDGVMGTARTAAPDSRNRLAYIFYNRIEHVGISNQIPIERILGHVIAHEIGHLLIGVNSHSDRGLMRPEWNPQESQVQTLTSSQVQTIRSRFEATVSHRPRWTWRSERKTAAARGSRASLKQHSCRDRPARSQTSPSTRTARPAPRQRGNAASGGFAPAGRGVRAAFITIASNE